MQLKILGLFFALFWRKTLGLLSETVVNKIILQSEGRQPQLLTQAKFLRLFPNYSALRQSRYSVLAFDIKSDLNLQVFFDSNFDLCLLDLKNQNRDWIRFSSYSTAVREAKLPQSSRSSHDTAQMRLPPFGGESEWTRCANALCRFYRSRTSKFWQECCRNFNFSGCVTYRSKRRLDS